MSITSKKQNHRIKWFTLLEIIISISILAIWFWGIFVLIQNSSSIAQQTQDKSLAINLTREAVEIIYNIRDTNRTRRSWDKESCRLKIDPLTDTNNDWCNNDDRMLSWRYIIQDKIKENEQYFSLQEVDIPWFMTPEDAAVSMLSTQLCETATWRNTCLETGNDNKIFRAVQIIWLYHKDTSTPWWDPIQCPNGDANIDIPCGSTQPKELRFCAHTYIQADRVNHTQLCSMLTNFQ